MLRRWTSSSFFNDRSIDAVLILVECIESQFVVNEQQDHYRNGNSDGKAGDVYD